MKKILSKFRKAIDKYSMVEDGDKIAIGLSGGKDSLMLVKCFSVLQKIYKDKFSVIAISIDMFNGKTDYKKIEEFCKESNIPFEIVPTNINEIVFDERKEKNPCSLCAKMRRGALINKAKELGCTKLALGHNADDLIETFFLSMFYEGRLSTFSPVTNLDKSNITVIRPLILVDEKDIVYYSKDFPILKNECLANHNTQREYIKKMIQSIKKDIPCSRKLIHLAIIHPERYNLFDKTTKKYDR